MITLDIDPHLLNPQPGDLWHERMIVILLVIAVVDDFILVSKRYIVKDTAYLGDAAEQLTFLNKDEFEKEVKYCYCVSQKEKWIDVIKTIGLPENPLDNEVIKKKYEEKIYSETHKLDYRYASFVNPKSGDTWYSQIPGYTDSKPILVVIDLYLKNFIIVLLVKDGIISFDNKTSFTIISLETFKDLIVTDTSDLNKGYLMSDVVLEKYKSEIEKFKRDQ